MDRGGHLACFALMVLALFTLPLTVAGQGQVHVEAVEVTVDGVVGYSRTPFISSEIEVRVDVAVEYRGANAETDLYYRYVGEETGEGDWVLAYFEGNRFVTFPVEFRAVFAPIGGEDFRVEVELRRDNLTDSAISDPIQIDYPAAGREPVSGLELVAAMTLGILLALGFPVLGATIRYQGKKQDILEHMLGRRDEELQFYDDKKMFEKKEWLVLVGALLITGASFAWMARGGWYGSNFWPNLFGGLVVVAFVITVRDGLEHLSARLIRAHAELRFIKGGTAATILTTVLFGITFGYPARSVEESHVLRAQGRSQSTVGMVRLFGLGAMLFPFGIIAGIDATSGFGRFAVGFLLMMLAVATIPTRPFDGGLIIRWQPLLAVLSWILSWGLYISWMLGAQSIGFVLLVGFSSLASLGMVFLVQKSTGGAVRMPVGPPQMRRRLGQPTMTAQFPTMLRMLGGDITYEGQEMQHYEETLAPRRPSLDWNSDTKLAEARQLITHGQGGQAFKMLSRLLQLEPGNLEVATERANALLNGAWSVPDPSNPKALDRSRDLLQRALDAFDGCYDLDPDFKYAPLLYAHSQALMLNEEYSRAYFLVSILVCRSPTETDYDVLRRQIYSMVTEQELEWAHDQLRPLITSDDLDYLRQPVKAIMPDGFDIISEG